MKTKTCNNPEYDFLVNELKLEKTDKCLAIMNYQQLKKFYLKYDLKNLEYNTYNYKLHYILNVIYKYKKFHSSEAEKKTWFLNIKHTYELLNQIPNIDSKEIYIYFEYKLTHNRIDTIIEYKDTLLIIEFSHLKETDSLETKMEAKKHQLINYCKTTKKYNNCNIYGQIYLDNVKETKDKTLNVLKQILND